MLKTALAIFIIAHGLVHSILAVAPNPADPNAKPGAFFTVLDRSWLLPQLGLNAATIHWIGIILVVFSTLGFILAGLGIFGIAGLSVIWRIVAIISAGTSLLLLVTFWHPWLLVGVLIDIGTLGALIVQIGPPIDVIGS
ncbi:MAG: hypothetical protein ISR58_12745 [Anaerolineales bacterium]|nr:hypothetical protein [Chloroflexota bacterium]MBL6982047.1 hypothetical protein [Anaerolineales bacterium]